jgi:hypothetical protein
MVWLDLADHSAVAALRFNDVHKQICAGLRLSDETARELRPMMVRWWAQRYSPNAILALTKMELKRRDEQRERDTLNSPPVQPDPGQAVPG